MTTLASDLLAAIDAGSTEACVRILSGLKEDSRRALHPHVARRIKEIDILQQDFSSKTRSRDNRREAVANLALLGVATLGELRAFGPGHFYGPYESAAIAILADRQPGWLSEWSELTLARNVGCWHVVRALVRRGLIPAPATEFYILGIIAAPHYNVHQRDFLASDPSLLQDELWRLFEHEGSSDLSLAAYDKYVPEARTWSAAFRGLVAKGIIDRARVLRASLDALQRDFAPFRAGWFSRLHEALKPSKAERVELCDRYLDLLGSRVPATVSFAMKALVEIHKAGALDVAKSASRLGPAFEARDKGTVERVLAIAGKTMPKASDDTKAKLAALAARALAHESPEIQTAALALIGTEEALIGPYLDMLAPSVRARLGKQNTETAQTIDPVAVVDHAPIQPITTLTELVESFAAVLENQGPPIDIERVIDAVARIGITAATHEAGFARTTAALAKRSQSILSRPRGPQPRAALAALALAWIKGHRSAQPEAVEDLEDFLVWRAWCLSEQTALRIEYPLLSMPSLPDGRIDPAEFDRRFASLTPAQAQAAQDPESLFHLDFLLARLRARGISSEPQFRLTWQQDSWTYEGRTYTHSEPTLHVEGFPAPGRFEPAALTAVQLHSTLEMKRWCATVSPRWCEGWFAAGCRDLGDNIDWDSADWSTRAYLEPLVNPTTPIGRMAALLIALGLGAKEAGESGLAVDALIATLSDERLDAVALGNALIEASASGAIKFSRWAKTLLQVAQTGAPQARTIFLALEVLIESGEGDAKGDFGRLLELELELAHLTGLRLTRAGAIGVLKTLHASGKTGKAAKTLLNL